MFPSTTRPNTSGAVGIATLVFFLAFLQNLLDILFEDFLNFRETILDDLHKVLVPIGLLHW